MTRSARAAARRDEPRPPPSPSEAIDIALRYLAARPRSEHEVRRRLRRTGLDEPAIDGLLGRLRASGLVDDAAFAHYWVEQRQTFRPRGTRLLEAELRQHGIQSELASAAAEPASSSAEDDAYRAAHRRARQLRGVEERTFRTRVGQFLARRGFDWDTVSPTVDRLWREVASEPE
jgi:regulatory protein